MTAGKIIRVSLLFILSTMVMALPISHAALPKNYKEKKIFYDSLSIVLNKYIVPVCNWGLFEGTLQGMQTLIGKAQFRLKPENNLLEVLIKDSPPLKFNKDDPAIKISLDILKRSLLLQDTPEEELEGLSDEQAAIKKRFNGLNRAVLEVTPQKKLQDF